MQITIKLEKSIIFLVVAAMLVFTGINLITVNTPARAQQDPMTMQTLLQGLKQRTIDEDGFTVSFKFVVPLASMPADWMTVPDWNNSSVNANYRVSIGEIGEDYICFNYGSTGSTIPVRCTPFSNIAEILPVPEI